MSRKERLDKVLSNMGYGTRKEVKALVKDGSVSVAGVIAKDPSMHVYLDEQPIVVLGKELTYREFIYLMMNKPEGVVSATEDNRDETVIDLLEPEHAHFEPFPVGRLDKDTVGLLLLTNDGTLSHNLLSPKKHVDKVYEALVEGAVGQSQIDAFKKGIKLDDGYVTMPAGLEVLEQDQRARTCKVKVTIKEGKYHQVKRMFKAVGGTVIHLKRIAMGPLVLDDDLEPGEYRELTDEELELLLGTNAKDND